MARGGYSTLRPIVEIVSDTQRIGHTLDFRDKPCSSLAAYSVGQGYDTQGHAEVRPLYIHSDTARTRRDPISHGGIPLLTTGVDFKPKAIGPHCVRRKLVLVSIQECFDVIVWQLREDRQPTAADSHQSLLAYFRGQCLDGIVSTLTVQADDMVAVPSHQQNSVARSRGKLSHGIFEPVPYDLIAILVMIGYEGMIGRSLDVSENEAFLLEGFQHAMDIGLIHSRCLHQVDEAHAFARCGHDEFKHFQRSNDTLCSSQIIPYLSEPLLFLDIVGLNHLLPVAEIAFDLRFPLRSREIMRDQAGVFNFLLDSGS